MMEPVQFIIPEVFERKKAYNKYLDRIYEFCKKHAPDSSDIQIPAPPSYVKVRDLSTDGLNDLYDQIVHWYSQISDMFGTLLAARDLSEAAYDDTKNLVYIKAFMNNKGYTSIDAKKTASSCHEDVMKVRGEYLYLKGLASYLERRLSALSQQRDRVSRELSRRYWQMEEVRKQQGRQNPELGATKW